MLRLHAFGTAFVACDDRPLEGAATQRRVLAILSVLAVQGPGGVSRDKLLGLLWPEAEPDRARHALTQSLYNVRRALRCDDAIVVGADLRLNPERISSDVGDFEAAVSKGLRREAARLYVGPLLDGLHVAQAPEFERWLSQQRERLAGGAARVMDALADETERKSALVEAADWRRRRLAIDPLDSGALKRLVATLGALGDSAGAVQQLRQHERRLREELGLPLPADLQRLADAWRDAPLSAAASTGSASAGQVRDGASRVSPPTVPAGPAFGPVSETMVAAPPTTSIGSVDAENSTRESTPGERAAADSSGPSGSGARRRWGIRRWAGWAAATALVAAGATAVMLPRRPQPSPLTAAPPPTLVGTPAVVVAPFRVAGADASQHFLREGIVELLSLRLADDTLARAVDPGAVLALWRRGGYRSEREPSRAEALRLAQRLGGALLVDGSVVGGAGSVVVSASVIAVATGRTLISERVDGSADSISVLVDQLAARLLASDAGEGERLPVHGPPALPAVRAFLKGQAAYRQERYAEAVREFENALEVDSTFALAALRLALAADKLNSAEQEDRALELAWAYRHRLTATDLAHLVAFAGPRYPAPSPEAEQLAAWERATAMSPDRSEVWQELGERFFYAGAVVGSVDWRARSASALRRALALEPAAPLARALLIVLAARGGDTATVRALASPVALRDSLGEHADFVRWRVAHVFRDAAALSALRARMPSLATSTLRWIAVAGVYDAIDVDDSERALRLLRARAQRARDVTDVLLAQHALALNEGRPIYALDMSEQLEQLAPASGAYRRLRVLDALFGDGDTTAAMAALTRMTAAEWRADDPAWRDGDASAVYAANRCVAELWRVMHGDRRTVAGTVMLLRRVSTPRVTLPVSTPPRACAHLLEAMAAVEGGRADALTRVQRLDSLMLTGPAIGDAAHFAPLAVARMYERLGYPDRALAAIRRRPYMSGWPRYLATLRRNEGRLARQLGETEAARDVLARYLALRRPEGPAAIAADARVRSAMHAMATE